jgi:hypothetical protein
MAFQEWPFKIEALHRCAWSRLRNVERSIPRRTLSGRFHEKKLKSGGAVTGMTPTERITEKTGSEFSDSEMRKKSKED